MAFYVYDHIHLLSPEPMATAQYFNRMFGARFMATTQPDGPPRVDPDLNGLALFIAQRDADAPRLAQPIRIRGRSFRAAGRGSECGSGGFAG